MPPAVISLSPRRGGTATALQRRLPSPPDERYVKLFVGLLTGRSRRGMTCALFLGEGVPTSVATDVPS
jgi:hypothetical protein